MAWSQLDCVHAQRERKSASPPAHAAQARQLEQTGHASTDDMAAAVDGLDTFLKAAQIALENWGLMKMARAESFAAPATEAKYDACLDDMLRNCEQRWQSGKVLHEEDLEDFFVTVCGREYW